MKIFKSSLIALAGVLVAMGILPTQAQDKETPPEAFFKEMSQKVENEQRFDGIESDFPELIEHPEVYVGNQQDLPAQAVRLDQWSEQSVVSSGFPVVFNPRLHRLELSRTTLSKSSEAVKSFAYYFCRAYNHLPPKLAQSGSPLAIGAAAVVASDILYPTTHADLPPEVIEPAAIVSVLLLQKHELLAALFSGNGDVESLVEQAVTGMNTVADTQGTGGKLPGVNHQDLRWLTSQSTEDSDVSFNDFVAIHPKAATELATRAAKIKNLRLQAYILEGVYQAQYGSPSVVAEALSPWEHLFDDLVRQAKQDLALRGKATHLAPAFGPDTPGNVIVADPNFLATLFSIATQLEVGSDTNTWNRESLNAMDETKLGALLQSSQRTKEVLDLAGSNPEITLAHETEAGGRTNILCRVIFGPMVRPYPAEWRNAPDKLLSLGFERVTCVWWRPEPVGEGKPYVGVHVDTLLTLVEGTSTRKVRARDIQPGDKILGFTGLPSPDSTNEFRLGSNLKEVPFTVVKIAKHMLHQHVALALTPKSGNSGQILLTAKTRIVNCPAGTDATGGWRNAKEVAPGSQTWASTVAATVNFVISRELPPGRSDEFVEIVLAGQKRKEANNFAVSLDMAGNEVAVVEAGPITSSAIPPDERIELTGDQAGQTLAVGQIQPDPTTEGKISGTTPSGYFVRPDDYPWDIPILSKYITWVLNTNGLPQQMAYKLRFEDDTVLTLGELSWVLTYSSNKLNETCVSPVTLKVGSSVVTGVNAGKPSTAILKSLEPILFNQGQRPVYTLLATANLGFVKVGPILVATEDVALDAFKGGLVEASKLSLLEGGGGAKQAMLAARSGKPREILPDTLAVSSTNLPEKMVASFDPMIALTNFMDTVLGPVDVSTTCRTLLIEATDPRSKAPVYLRLGPAQTLLIRRGLNPPDYVKAAELLPGDAIYLARAAAIAPVEVQVRCVTPQFHLPDVFVLTLTRKLENVYEDTLLPTGPVAFDDGFAVGLDVPGFHVNKKPAAYLEGDGPGGGASGATVSNQRIGKAEKLELLNLLDAKEKTGSVVDIIDLPPEVRRQLQERGGDLTSSFAAEKGRLQPLSQSHQVFWNHCLKDTLENSLKDMKASHAEFARTNNAFDEVSAMIGAKLPYEESGTEGMERWMGMLLERREKFIAKSSTARFSEVVFLETVMGSWLHEMGATNTANQLQDEVVELSLLAAADPDRAKVRARVENLKMLLLIEAPTFISGMDPKLVEDFPIDIPAQDAVKSWGSRSDVELVTTNGAVSLASVKAQLVAEIGKSVAPVITGIPNIGSDGELSATPWPSTDPLFSKDIKENGEELKEWLRTLALDIALGYSDTSKN